MYINPGSAHSFHQIREYGVACFDVERFVGRWAFSRDGRRRSVGRRDVRGWAAAGGQHKRDGHQEKQQRQWMPQRESIGEWEGMLAKRVHRGCSICVVSHPDLIDAQYQLAGKVI